MKSKTLLCMFVAGLIFISFVNANEPKIIANPDIPSEELENQIYYFDIIPPEPDTVPPVISNIQIEKIKKNTFNITWETNEPSYFNTVKYGRGKKYGYKVSQEFNTNSSIRLFTSYKQSILLTLKKPGNYRYKVQSCDLFGNCAYSDDYKIKERMFKRKKI